MQRRPSACMNQRQHEYGHRWGCSTENNEHKDRGDQDPQGAHTRAHAQSGERGFKRGNEREPRAKNAQGRRRGHRQEDKSGRSLECGFRSQHWERA
jgi:hypothetical protein